MSDFLALRGRQRSRWWLAGLLVGCLLPASLAQGDAARWSMRIVHACLLVPAAIRAESRRHGRRRRYPLRQVDCPHSIVPAYSVIPADGILPYLTRPSIGHDVFSRRGPPCSAEA